MKAEVLPIVHNRSLEHWRDSLLACGLFYSNVAAMSLSCGCHPPLASQPCTNALPCRTRFCYELSGEYMNQISGDPGGRSCLYAVVTSSERHLFTDIQRLGTYSGVEWGIVGLYSSYRYMATPLQQTRLRGKRVQLTILARSDIDKNGYVVWFL